ncbi:MAG: NADH-quinone oxidoreductase subunit J, partial [Acidimicrobiia bacterium]|nr:NADH-quinone oxidoreductase subunit J [Acidimicrobiia bacterium]
GAVVVLFLFGIMLTRAEMGDDQTVAKERRGMAALVGVILASVMVYALIDSFDDRTIERLEPSSTAEVSDSIFSDYIIAFEAVSVLLLAALIGAIVLARRE